MGKQVSPWVWVGLIYLSISFAIYRATVHGQGSSIVSKNGSWHVVYSKKEKMVRALFSITWPIWLVVLTIFGMGLIVILLFSLVFGE